MYSFTDYEYIAPTAALIRPRVCSISHFRPAVPARPTVAEPGEREFALFATIHVILYCRLANFSFLGSCTTPTYARGAIANISSLGLAVGYACCVGSGCCVSSIDCAVCGGVGLRLLNINNKLDK